MASLQFKVGDRVAVYWWACGGNEVRITGTVKWLDFNRVNVTVDPGQQATSGDFHPKQCRRLKPKKRREFWIVAREANSAHVLYSEPSKQLVESDSANGCEFIHVREVKRRAT